jgi:hypothetical protein
MAKNHEELMRGLAEAIKILESIKDDEKNNGNKWRTLQPRQSTPMTIPNRSV